MSVHDNVLGIDRSVVVPKADYLCRVSKDEFSRTGYTAIVSTELVHAPKATYEQMLAMLPEGYRIGLLEPIAELRRLEQTAKAEGKSVREALKDPLFERLIIGNHYRWERTGAAFRVPKGRATDKYETDKQGRKYWPRIYVLGEQETIEALIPEGNGRKVVEWNYALNIPGVTSDGDDVHTTHFYFDPAKSEVAVDLDGYGCYAEDDGCLLFNAYWWRSGSSGCAAFRLVQGSLDDVPFPVVKKAA